MQWKRFNSRYNISRARAAQADGLPRISLLPTLVDSILMLFLKFRMFSLVIT